MAKQKQIFRKEAMDRMSSPEQLDELMPITSARGWIALCGLSVLLVMGVVWEFAGVIDTTVDASGVLVRTNAVYAVESPTMIVVVESSVVGFVNKVHVESGDEVEKGKTLIELSVEGGGKKQILIKAEEAGRVLTVSVIAGDSVDKKSPLLMMEAVEKPLQAILYVPAKDGYRIIAGLERLKEADETMSVLVHPVTGQRPISGTVVKVARFPATRTAMQRMLRNQEWGAEVLQRGPVLEIIVRLDPKTDVEVIGNLLSGTPCGATITVSSKRPVSFVLPIFENR